MLFQHPGTLADILALEGSNALLSAIVSVDKQWSLYFYVRKYVAYSLSSMALMKWRKGANGKKFPKYIHSHAQKEPSNAPILDGTTRPMVNVEDVTQRDVTHPIGDANDPLCLVVIAAATKIGKSAESVRSFLSILRNNWYDTPDSLRSVTADDLTKLGIPHRLAVGIILEVSHVFFCSCF